MNIIDITDAVSHCKEIISSEDTCEKCKIEHKQLMKWLKELEQYRSVVNNALEIFRIAEIEAKTYHEKLLWNSLVELLKI